MDISEAIKEAILKEFLKELNNNDFNLNDLIRLSKEYNLSDIKLRFLIEHVDNSNLKKNTKKSKNKIIRGPNSINIDRASKIIESFIKEKGSITINDALEHFKSIGYSDRCRTTIRRVLENKDRFSSVEIGRVKLYSFKDKK